MFGKSTIIVITFTQLFILFLHLNSRAINQIKSITLKHLPYYLVLFLFVFNACSDNKVEPNNNEPFQITKAASSVVEATNNFTFSIFQQIEAENPTENIFFSPLSMSTALSMAMNGANGETKQQIKDVIDFGDYTDEEINEAFKNLQDAFINLDE